ncbi:shikimate kinase [Streptococcus didelphis]|uniref:shikimate kinase n=1 Tax=Streptococcus didelphis TaxID=102886 RepID=UPI00036212D4|nr:shikimate kinase [Streptococcus didelphis]WMB30029.1 shikimate kinase [Streptococcus didelphis]
MTKLLLGFMGAGKTTIGALLSENVLDMDTLIEERIQMSISDFFAKEGEEAFRKIESNLLEELLLSQEDRIISTGGGVVISAKNRELICRNKKNNILFSASFEVLYERIKKDKVCQRPLFLNNSKAAFQAIFDKRMVLYQGLADTIINVDNKTPQEIAAIINRR